MPEPETPIETPTPGVDVPLTTHDNNMFGSARDRRHVHTEESLDQLRLGKGLPVPMPETS